MRPAVVKMLGGRIVGEHATDVAVGVGVRVTLLNNNVDALRRLAQRFGALIRAVYSDEEAHERAFESADLVIGAVLVPRARAPRLVSKETVDRMRPGSVVVHVSIDQGECFESSSPTTHDEPTFALDEVVHYCVTNKPGVVPRTSRYALINATLPFGEQVADLGVGRADSRNALHAEGISIHRGAVVQRPDAGAFGYELGPSLVAANAPLRGSHPIPSIHATRFNQESP